MSDTYSKDDTVGSIIGVRNDVSDTSIVNGLKISSIIGGCLMISFCILQRTSVLYRYRLVAKNVRVKPPQLELQGLRSLIDWAVKAITVGDIELVQSAGLDALVMVKLCALGVQIFLPMCILGVTIFIPLHWFGGESSKIDIYHSTFMKLTMSNFSPGSKAFWVHFVFIYVYMGWTMLLLRWHYHQYLTIRQHYLRKGDDVNKWRTLFDGHSKRWNPDGVDIPMFLSAVPLLKSLLPGLQPDFSQRGTQAGGDSDSDEDAPQEPLQCSGPTTAVAASMLPGVLKASSSVRFSTDVRRRHGGHSQPSHVTWQRLASTVDSEATGRVGVCTGNLSSVAIGTDHPNVAAQGLGPVLSEGTSAASGTSPAAGKPGTRHVDNVSGGATEPPGGSSPVAGTANTDGRNGINGAHEGTQLRPPAKLPTKESNDLASHFPNGFAAGQTGRAEGGWGPDSRDRPSIGTAGPLGEATEHPPDGRLGPAAALAAAGSGPIRAESSAHTVGSGSTSTQNTSYHRMHSPFAQLSMIRTPLEVEMQLGPLQGRTQQGPPSGANPRAGAAVGPAPPSQLDAERGQAGDVEAGPPSRGSMQINTAASAPRAPSIMTRGDSLDTEAHRLEWYADFGRLRYGGVDQAPVRPPSGSGLTWDKDAVSLSRPSVGHRKTVNTVDWRGQPVAVLAQHYAVLVTDVVDHKLEERKRKVREKAKAETGGARTKPSRTSRIANVIPLSVRRWWNLGYGNQAAAKLDTVSVASSCMAELATDQPSMPLSSLARSTGTGSRPSYHAQLTSRASDTDQMRLTGTIRARPGHRRTFSTGDAGVPLLQPGVQLPIRELSGLVEPGNPAAGNGLGPAASEPVASATAATAAGSASQRSTGGSGRQLTPQRSGGANTSGRSSQFMQLIGMLSERALEARTATLAQQADAARLHATPTKHQLAGTTSGEHGEVSGGPDRRASLPPLPPQPSSSQHPKRKSLAHIFTGGHHQGNGKAGNGAGAGGGALAGGGEPLVALPGDDGLPITAIEVGPPEPDDSPRRRRRHATGPVAEGTEAGEGVADGAALALGKAPDAPRASDAGQDNRPSSDTAVSGASAPLCKWDLVREAVWDGRVAQLPYKARYSVVSSTFLKLFPDEFDRAIPVINHQEVDLLLMQADMHMAKYEYAKKYEEVTGQELYGRIGACGLFGKRRRLREYHAEHINRLMEKVRDARRRAFESNITPSWFVFFRTQRAAAIASQCVIHAEDNRQFRVHPAPGPEEVNWSALWSDFASRDLRRNLVRPLLVLVILFPIAIFSGALMQLDYLLCPEHVCKDLPQASQAWTDAHCTAEIVRKESAQLAWVWYCKQENFIALVLKQLVIGWLPSLLVTVWQGMVLPLCFTYIVQTSRSSRSLSEADRAIAKNMFYFAVFNVFLGGLVGSTIIQGINSAIEKGPSEIFNLIGNYVPTSSNFFINYTMFRTLVALPLRMLWPHIGVRMYLIRRFLRFSCIITKRDKAFLLSPVSPRYGFEVGMILLIFVIAFAYAVVSPLLLVFAVFFFMVCWLFWRWALLYVYVRKYEGGGTMWPFIFSCILVCLGIFPLFTACVFVTKHAYIQAIIVLVTVPVILIRFNSYCYHRFQRGIDSMPLKDTIYAPVAHVDPWVYMPPPLLPNLPGWNPDWSKCWQGWNMPVMYG